MRLRFFAAAGIVLLSLAPSWAFRPKIDSVPGEVVVQAYPGIDLASMVRTKAAKSVNDATPSPFFEGISLSAPVAEPQGKTPKGRSGTARNDRGLSGLFLLRGDTQRSSEDLVQAALSLPGVLRAEPNYVGSLAYVPSDPLYVQTADHFARIGMEDAWDVQQGGVPSVTIAVIDSGVDPTHVDLKAAIHPASHNFVEFNDHVFDDLGHGTRVAGVIGAVGNNSEGIAGAAFGVQILSCDVVDSSGVLTIGRTLHSINLALIGEMPGIDVHEKILTYDITILDLNSGRLCLIKVKGMSNPSVTILLTPNERHVVEDRRDCYWLCVVSNRVTQPILQEVLKNLARVEWKEVVKVAHYWIQV